MNPQKIIVYVVLALVIIGIAIPKLTVYDRIDLTEAEKSCVQTSIKQQLDHPLQRLALALGKSAVVEKQGDGIIKPNTLIVKSYTLFRIPLPATRLFNRFTQQVSICDWSATTIDPTPRPLSDGATIEGLGQFHNSPVANGIKAYQSEKLGISLVGVLLKERSNFVQKTPPKFYVYQLR